MGRTGRKRKGRVLLLLAGDKEISKYEQSKKTSSNLSIAMRNPLQSLTMFTARHHRMIPEHLPLPRMFQQKMEVRVFFYVGGRRTSIDEQTVYFQLIMPLDLPSMSNHRYLNFILAKWRDTPLRQRNSLSVLMITTTIRAMVPVSSPTSIPTLTTRWGPYRIILGQISLPAAAAVSLTGCLSGQQVG